MKYRNFKISAALSCILAAIGLAVYFSQEILNFGGQVYIGWGSFLVIYLMAKFKVFEKQPWRSIFMALALLISFRYIAWRIFDTLIYSGFFDFIGTALLILAELYGFSLLLLDMFVNFWPSSTKIIPLSGDPSRYPTVDIFIPTYDEAENIVRMTATAATQIDYPKEKLNIYILDDGGTHAKRQAKQGADKAWVRHYCLRGLAQELGIHYITRETNQKAKAGNINHALQYSNGELLLILDCDQIPTKDILKNTVGQFLIDPRMFLVQTPHFFINETPVNNVITGISNRPDESEMFYRKILPAMNFWNAAFFCGSAAVLRRTYLMEVGGIAVKSITEDCETSLLLHAQGLNSCYINRPMVCGLSPESPTDYLTQHSRWAKGMLQILMFYNPLFMSGLTIPQRIAYFSSCYSWFFGFARVVFFLAPSAFLILSLNIYTANWREMLDFTVPYALTILTVISFLFRGSRPIFFSEIYETIKVFRLMRELVPVMLNPWNHQFMVTPKGRKIETEQLSWDAFPLFVLIAVNVISICIAVVRWHYEPIWHANIVVTSIWCVINIWLGLMALGSFWEKIQIRGFYRIGGSGKVKVTVASSSKVLIGEIEDVSVSGIGVKLPFSPKLNIGEAVELKVEDGYGAMYIFNATVARVQQELDHALYGTEFIAGQVASPEAISFVYGDSFRWQTIWNESAQLKQARLQLLILTRLGLKALRTNSITYFAYFSKGARSLVWKMINPYFWVFIATSVTSWFLYIFYLSAVFIIALSDRSRVRKFPRLQAGENVRIYFPKLDATIEGWGFDMSLTGIGIRADLPIDIRENELAQVIVNRVIGGQFKLDCKIRRAEKHGKAVILGAEFIIDNLNYSKLISFVYGRESKMIFALAVKNLLNILAILFINPKLLAARKQKL
jgi:cellulose synthase (UDP-forming)